MSIHLTRIYTKTGDTGTTALGDLSRVRKTDPRLVAYADVDEASASLGVVLALGSMPDDIRSVLGQVQNDLYDVGADLCVPVGSDRSAAPLRVTDAYVERLERWCDKYNENLPALTSFILPGGTAAAALLHQARTVTRRAERSVWALLEVDAEHTGEVPARYLNRLSDLLFILARAANPDGDVLWRPTANA